MRRTPSRRVRLLGAAVALPAIAALGLAGCRPPVMQAACNGTLTASTTGPVVNGNIVEASGIAASHLVDDVYWVHNDSGNAAEVYRGRCERSAISARTPSPARPTRTGRTSRSVPDRSPACRTSTSPTSATMPRRRATLAVYRVPEPTVNPAVPTGGSLAAEKLTFTYPDGPHDAEAFMVDPVTGDLFVVTKTLSDAQVFRAPANLAAGSTTALTQVATVSFGVPPRPGHRRRRVTGRRCRRTAHLHQRADVPASDGPAARGRVRAAGVPRCRAGPRHRAEPGAAGRGDRLHPGRARAT